MMPPRPAVGERLTEGHTNRLPGRRVLPRLCLSGGCRNRDEVLSGDGVLHFCGGNARTRTSSVGGGVLAYFRSEESDRTDVLLPSKINSCSFSRCASCFQTGMAAVIMIAMTLMTTSSTAIA